jgi:hypothetical protein
MLTIQMIQLQELEYLLSVKLVNIFYLFNYILN